MPSGGENPVKFSRLHFKVSKDGSAVVIYEYFAVFDQACEVIN